MKIELLLFAGLVMLELG